MGTSQAVVALDLDAYHGRVVYLDFWASWCTPCRQSFPWMEGLAARYQAQGLTVVAVNLDRDRAAADRFLARFAPTFDVPFDPSGELARRFKVHAMPSSLLIDRQGVVRFEHAGFVPIDASTYEEQIRALLAEF